MFVQEFYLHQSIVISHDVELMQFLIITLVAIESHVLILIAFTG
jgi:hypothetical protein